MARGIWRRTPPSGTSFRSRGPRRWLCPGCPRARTGSPPPAPPAPRAAPAHLITTEAHPVEKRAWCPPGHKWLAHTHAHKRLQNMQNQQKTEGLIRGEERGEVNIYVTLKVKSAASGEQQLTHPSNISLQHFTIVRRTKRNLPTHEDERTHAPYEARTHAVVACACTCPLRRE